MSDVLSLSLRVNPATGKRELVIDYESDSDALPIEHEDTHKRLAEKVFDKNSPNIEVTRGTDEVPAAPEAAPAKPTGTRTANKC